MTSSPKATAEQEWVEWNGGDGAPADWDGVGVRFRLGTYTPDADGSYDWKRGLYPEDIVAYRARPTEQVSA